jgi:hypothetical protein
VLIFLSSFSGCRVFSNFVIFHYIKVAKHIWYPCCHLVAETDNGFPLIKAGAYPSGATFRFSLLERITIPLTLDSAVKACQEESLKLYSVFATLNFPHNLKSATMFVTRRLFEHSLLFVG